MIRLLKVACVIVISFSLWFYIQNRRIERELDKENGIIHRRYYSPQVLQRIIGLNKPDMVQITQYDHERVFAFPLSAQETSFLINRFGLKFDRITSLAALTNTIDYDKVSKLTPIDSKAEIWEIYENSLKKEDVLSIAHGFDNDYRLMHGYAITLIVNEKTDYCFFRIREIPVFYGA